jgi:hypothetical protein
MRLISLDNLYIPDEWESYAKDLSDKIAGMNRSERSKALGKDTDYQIWTLLIPLLSGISYGKCFYTEAKIGESGEVDHFRPKSRVQGCDLPKGKKHGGYFWLAFVVENFRFCRSASNKRRTRMSDGRIYGKGTRFPLHEANQRVEDEGTDLATEQQLLLDPTKAEDVRLLKFKDNGDPVSLNEDPQSLEYKRVRASIELYNLNEREIQERRGATCTQAKRLASRIVDQESKKTKGQQYNQREMIEKEAILRELTQPYCEFSSAVRCVVSQYKTSPIIKRILA